MWCERCGKELAENARFCTGCGTPVIQNAERASGQEQVPDTTPMPTPEKAKVPKSPKSMSKVKKITVVVLLGVMVLAIAAAALFANWHISERNKEAALQIAADYAKNGDYENAIHTVISTRNYEKDVRLNTAYQNYCAEYEAQILSVVDDLITVENYYAAQKTAIEAIGILPKSEKLRDAYAKCQWDQVLLENADFSVVRKDLDCYDSYTVRVGILDSNGDWICPLSSSCIFALAINDTGNLHSYNGNRIKIDSGNFAYLGEGVIVASLGLDIHTATGKSYSIGSNYSLSSHGLECYLYNIDTKESNHFSATDLSTCEDGYMLRYDSDRYNGGFSRVSKNGEVVSIPVGRAVNDFAYPTYSEGLFFANGVFYDIFGEKKIDMTSYQLVNTPFFQDGKAEILFENSGQTTYRATIDKSGAFVESPAVYKED